ncbi:hypothetical protein GCM10011581_46130 [Saccharopolyspora subtropica]|uniref:Uncharacterized protein n=1 Tax=Saccharopolyspora thermophila TaxID=89367 RepID=A0A917K7V1_9PSEU|nr:hypothetical protein [Saccharopolyspora subtropica]GGJ03873.1 hypothetical protein GCM10011581_46130 [Saccharopolyspora subtropica]
MLELMFTAALVVTIALAVCAIRCARRARQDAEEARQDAHRAQRRIDQYEAALRLVDQPAPSQPRHRRHLRSVKSTGPAGRLQGYAREHPATTTAVASTLAAVASIGMAKPNIEGRPGEQTEPPTVPNVPIHILQNRAPLVASVATESPAS